MKIPGKDIHPTSHPVIFDIRSFYNGGRVRTNRESCATIIKMLDPRGHSAINSGISFREGPLEPS